MSAIPFPQNPASMAFVPPAGAAGAPEVSVEQLQAMGVIPPGPKAEDSRLSRFKDAAGNAVAFPVEMLRKLIEAIMAVLRAIFGRKPAAGEGDADAHVPVAAAKDAAGKGEVASFAAAKNQGAQGDSYAAPFVGAPSGALAVPSNGEPHSILSRTLAVVGDILSAHAARFAGEDQAALRQRAMDAIFSAVDEQAMDMSMRLEQELTPYREQFPGKSAEQIAHALVAHGDLSPQDSRVVFLVGASHQMKALHEAVLCSLASRVLESCGDADARVDHLVHAVPRVFGVLPPECVTVAQAQSYFDGRAAAMVAGLTEGNRLVEASGMSPDLAIDKMRQDLAEAGVAAAESVPEEEPSEPAPVYAQRPGA